jgi:predicted Zn-dependent protease
MKKILLLTFVLIGIVLLLREEYKIKHYSDLYDSQVSKVEKKDQVIYISGLGKYSQPDLETVSKEITKMFGFKCEIIEPTQTDSSLYTVNGKLNALICAKTLNSNNKTVYVTNEYIMSHNKIVAGSSFVDGNFAIVSNNFKDLRNTALHEFAHTLGLDHCENHCLLGEIDLGDNTGGFCNDCKLKLKTNLK